MMRPVSTERIVATPHGDARLVIRGARHPRLTLLLSHGAGNGIDSHDLASLARWLPRLGITVVLLEQPWRVAGKKVATAPSTLDRALIAGASVLRTRTPLVVGGRSAGARSAARCARELGASAVLALSFPLHPPGRPEKSRVAELSLTVPTLIVQGARDSMGRPEEFPSHLEVVTVPDADHALKVPARSELTLADVDTLVVNTVRDWLLRLFGNRLGA